MNHFEKQGFWWFPAAPDKRIAGTLVFGNETKAELRLLGTLHDDMHAFKMMSTWGTESKPDIILGLAEDGKEYTLYNSMQNGCRLRSGFPITESFLPSIVLEGRHFQHVDEMVFDNMTIQLSHLGEWYQRTGKQVEFGNPDDEKRKITLVYQKLDPLTVQYDSGHIEIGHGWNVKFARFSGDFVVSENACMSVNPDHPTRMLEFLDDWLPPLIHFITLGVGRPLSMMELRGKCSADCGGRTQDEIKRAPSVQLYWQKPRYGDEEEELFPHNMIFVYPDIQATLDTFLNNWMVAYKAIMPVMQLFFNRVLPRESFSVNSFLNSVQAAEAYHRYRRGGTDLPEKEHHTRIDAIVSSVPDEHRRWLEDRLQYSNEVGLRRRVKELLRERIDLFELTPSDIKRLADRVTSIRNYFTHYSGEEDPEFATGHDFYVFDTLMQWTVMACLLEEMGIEHIQAHKLISRNQSFLHFKTVYLKQRQVALMSVEQVMAEDIPGSEPGESLRTEQ